MKTMTKKELANIAGYTYRRLYDIDRHLSKDKKIFVESEDGKYDLALFVQNWVAYNVALEKKDGHFDLEEIKAKHEAIKAEKTKIEVDKMRGQLIDVQDAKRLWGDVANTVTQNFLHLPSKIAPMVYMIENVEEITGIIEEEIKKILNGIAETPLPDYAAEDKDDGKEDTGEV